MVALLDTIIIFPVVVYTIPLGICLVFWLFSLLGVFDLDVLDVDIDTDADVPGLLATFGFAGVPITLSLSILFFFAWTLTLFASTWILPLLNISESVLFIAGAGILIVSFIIAVLITGKITRPLSKLFVTHEAKSNYSNRW